MMAHYFAVLLPTVVAFIAGYGVRWAVQVRAAQINNRKD